MKILFLARYLPQEGSTTHMYTLAEGLIDRGHEIHILSAGPKIDESAQKLFKGMVKKGIIHHKVSFPLKPGFGLGGKIIQLGYYLFSAPKALLLMMKIKPDVIHVHYPVTSYLAKIYRIFTGKKFITTHHISGIPNHILHYKADYVIAISRELETELINEYDYRKNQVKLIFNGVSIKKFSNKSTLENKKNSKQLLGLPNNKITIGFMGSLNYRKGIDVLLEGVSKLKEDDFHVVLVGDGDINWVNFLVTQYKLEDKVTIYPFQDPIIFYSAFDVFVLPSRTEGFPLVPLEAMMMGIPPIRSNVEGSNDQITNGISGFIFENENSDELAGCIKSLVKDSELRNSMAKKSYEKVMNNFTEKIMIDKLLEVYKKTVK